MIAMALVAGCGGGGDQAPDEDAWRAVREAQLGHEFADWNNYVELWSEICEKDNLDFTIATLLDGGADAEGIRTDIGYACPDRSDDVEQVLGFLGYNR